MELIRIEDKNGIRYITNDNKYRIWKFYRKADWELAEITGHGNRVIKYFKYFKDAKKYLENMLYEERLKRDREYMWKFVEEYKARNTKYPLHPDTEMRMKNDWAMSANVKYILGEYESEKDIENALNNFSILFKKRTVNSFGNARTMIEFPVHDGTFKILVKP